MKKLLLLLVAINCKAQDTLVFEKPDLFKRNYVEIGYGNSQGNLSNKFEKSLNIGIWFRNKVNRNQFVDVGLELNFLSNAKNINYSYINENIELQPNNFGLHLGVRYSKIVYLSSNNQNFYIESNSGLGWSALYYKKPKEIIEKDYDFNSNLNTIHFSQTLKINYKSIGIYLQYKFTPYSLFNKKIESDFGNSTINIGIVKGFNM